MILPRRISRKGQGHTSGWRTLGENDELNRGSRTEQNQNQPVVNATKDF